MMANVRRRLIAAARAEELKCGPGCGLLAAGEIASAEAGLRNVLGRDRAARSGKYSLSLLQRHQPLLEVERHVKAGEKVQAEQPADTAGAELAQVAQV